MLPSDDTITAQITRSPFAISVFVLHVQLGVQLVLLLVALTAVARRTGVGKAMIQLIRSSPVVWSLVGIVNVKLPAVTVCEPKV